ncbi:MAG: DEAD/DEAH box helicase [Gammaproteobacteria bacterium]|nr:DEAD/DEAH box helicase [Gammaproteobacteria bacterium]
MTFKTLGLPEPIVRAVTDLGYTTPTSIQTKVIPTVMMGKDVLASAQTGTGKTAGFVLPLLARLSSMPKPSSNQANILVLAPTRELAAQIHASVLQYAKHLKIRSAVVFGGVKINPQMMALRPGVDILIATPGRLLDLYQQRALRLDHIQALVLDEADRMLDMGFIHDIKKIMSYMPKSRQTLLFSATFSKEICLLAKAFLNHPLEIAATPRNETAAEVSQIIHPVDKARKAALLSHLIRENFWTHVLVFSRTKHGANKLVKTLSADGINATAIHGNKSQAQRTRALAEFKNGKVQVLVATDIAARGIDIDQLPVVINVDLPTVPEDYVHRIGRTGRAGAVGAAISLVCADEIKPLLDIEKLIKGQLKRVEIDDFEPQHALPTTMPKNMKTVPRRPSKLPSKGQRSDKKRWYAAPGKNTRNKR